jgi:hypothetical protein
MIWRRYICIRSSGFLSLTDGCDKSCRAEHFISVREGVCNGPDSTDGDEDDKALPPTDPVNQAAGKEGTKEHPHHVDAAEQSYLNVNNKT